MPNPVCASKYTIAPKRSIVKGEVGGLSSMLLQPILCCSEQLLKDGYKLWIVGQFGSSLAV